MFIEIPVAVLARRLARRVGEGWSADEEAGIPACGRDAARFVAVQGKSRTGDSFEQPFLPRAFLGEEQGA
ncbi:MAG: hypothetical protein ACRDRQ_05600 [Pseudonocardiaceae bacterium]